MQMIKKQLAKIGDLHHFAMDVLRVYLGMLLLTINCYGNTTRDIMD